MSDNLVMIYGGSFVVRWYGIIVLLAVIVGITCAAFFRIQQQKDPNDALLASIIALPFAFIFARAYYCWSTEGKFFSSLADGGYALPGALYGAALGVLLAALIMRFFLHRDTSIGSLLDAFSPAFALAIAIGRFTGLVSAENRGPMVAEQGLFTSFSSAEGAWRISLFVYQIILAALLFAALFWLHRQKYFYGIHTCADGNIFWLFMAVYFVYQGVFECHRVDALAFPKSLLGGQLVVIRLTHAVGGGITGFVGLTVLLLKQLKATRRVVSVGVLGLFCALFYMGYFFAELQIGSASVAFNNIWQILSAAGLICVAFLSYFCLSAERHDNRLFAAFFDPLDSRTERSPVRGDYF